LSEFIFAVVLLNNSCFWVIKTKPALCARELLALPHTTQHPTKENFDLQNKRSFVRQPHDSDR